MVMRTTMLLVLAAAALGACKWTEFDDLADQTWVASTEKPGVKSSDYGVAIQRGARSTTGGTLVVIGASQPTFSELVYDAQGNTKLSSNTLELNSQFGIGTLDTQPIVLADPSPSSDDIALIVNGGGSQVLALIGSGQLSRNDLFVNPSTVDAATYMKPPKRTDAGHAGEAQPTRPLVASGDVVLGALFGTPPNPQPTCRLVDGANAIKPRALGAVHITGTVTEPDVDDVLAWGENGKLYRYPGTVFNGCVTQTPQPTTTGQATGVSPAHGAQILSLGGTRVLLQGHQDSDDASVLRVFDGITLMPVGASVSLPKLRTAAILDVGTDQYVIAGYPAEIVGGKAAGQVRLFKINATGPTAGIDPQPVATLNDAQPEDNQSFGRAVAAMPFNGTPIIAVAADNEIFMYFRANLTSGSPLYNETRQGR
jgi:hypothetical protein